MAMEFESVYEVTLLVKVIFTREAGMYFSEKYAISD